MSETTKRARGDAGEDRRPVRRDPRAEPDTPTPSSADPRGHGAEKSVRQDATRDRRPSPSHVPPSSMTRASAAHFQRASTADAPPSGPAPDSNASLGVAGAVGLASLRRQLATLQLQLADAQGQLAHEQQGRAEDADALAALLEKVASAERAVAEAADLRIELEREREFVEELRASVREKYEDGNTLRQRLAEAQTLVARGLEEAADRHALAERVELLERHHGETKKERDGARASEEAKTADLGALSTRLEESRRERESLDGELQKANVALKNANMKAFAANKQLESWKVESERTIEQFRVEHRIAVDALQGEVVQGSALAAALRKQLDDAASNVGKLATLLETLDEKEREMEGLRELARSARRVLLDQAGDAQKALTPLASAPELAPPPAPVASGGPRPATSRAPRPPVPPRPAPLAKLLAEPVSRPRLEDAKEAPFLEISETEMRAEDLFEELLEAQNLAQKRAKDGNER